MALKRIKSIVKRAVKRIGPAKRTASKTSTGRAPARKAAAKQPAARQAARKAPAKKRITKAASPRMPGVGEQAPDFTLLDVHGHAVTLSKLRGTQVVIYFYPKDDTPGCTLEAKEFTKNYNRFLERGVVVFGISKDTAESHRAFAEKHDLEVPLLSDPTGETIRKYGCRVEKDMYGKKVMGTRRATFIIDKNGRIQHVFPDVTPEGHVKEVLAKL